MQIAKIFISADKNTLAKADKIKQRRKNMYCKKCGAPIPDGNNFCQNCGTAVTAVNESTTGQTAAQQPLPAEQKTLKNQTEAKLYSPENKEKINNILEKIKIFFKVRFLKFLKNYKNFKKLPKQSKIKHILFPIIIVLVVFLCTNFGGGSTIGGGSTNNLDNNALNYAQQLNSQYGYTCEKVEIKDKDDYGRYIIYHRAINQNGNIDMGFDFVIASKNGNCYNNTLIDMDINTIGLNNYDYKNRSEIKWGKPLSEMNIEGLE